MPRGRKPLGTRPPIGGDTYKLVATWIPTDDFDILSTIVKDNNVTIGAYLRACINDLIQDELNRRTLAFGNCSLQSHSTNSKINL